MLAKAYLLIINETCSMDVSMFQLRHEEASYFLSPYTSAQYHVLLFGGKGAFSLDFTEYDFDGDTVLFLALIRLLAGWEMHQLR